MSINKKTRIRDIQSFSKEKEHSQHTNLFEDVLTYISAKYTYFRII